MAYINDLRFILILNIDLNTPGIGISALNKIYKG